MQGSIKEGNQTGKGRFVLLTDTGLIVKYTGAREGAKNSGPLENKILDLKMMISYREEL